MKLVFRTVAVLVVAYACYAALVLLPAWLPSLPAPPRLPLIDPQEVFSDLGVLPGEVSRRIDEARGEAEDLRARAEDLGKEVDAQRRDAEKQARGAAEEAGKKLEKERKKREDEARKALGL